MNAHFTQKPTPRQVQLASQVSERAKQLVRDYGGEVADSAHWPNADNVRNTHTTLLAYIAELERGMPPDPARAKAEKGHGLKDEAPGDPR